MNNSPTNWFNESSKKQILIILIIWAVSITLLLIGTTESLSKVIPPNALLLSILPSIIVVLSLFINYRKKQEKN